MTRTTDPDDHEHFQPLGAPIRKPEPAPAPAPKPQGPSGIVTDPATGRMRTTTHKEPK